MPTKKLREAIGARLREARTLARLTQEDVAAEIGRSRQSISAWESGRTMPSLVEFRELSIRYGVSADRMLHGLESVTRAGEMVLDRAIAAAKASAAAGQAELSE